jgi:ATP-binding cassette, subfamily B, bacterial
LHTPLRQNHFVVLYKIKNDKYFIADPSAGLLKLDEKTFTKNWYSHKELHDGVSLLLSPSPLFYEQEEEKKSSVSWLSIIRYFYAYKKLSCNWF